MKLYLDLLRRIIDEGEDVQSGATIVSEQRQPVCRTLLGQQLRFDLRDGFPAVTTKPVPFDVVVDEVLWFLRGQTNINQLGRAIDQDIEEPGGRRGNVSGFVQRHIWDQWSQADGNVPWIYGYQWRRQEHVTLREQQVFPPVTREELDALITEHGEPTVLKVGFRGTPNGSDHYYKMLQGIWIGMLHRCYDQTRPEYAFYGARGIHVDPRWLVFANFQEDAKRLPGWRLKSAFLDQYWLDKDLAASNRYGPQTCCWASTEEQHLNIEKAKLIKAIDPLGNIRLTIGGSRFARLHGLDPSSVYKCLRGERAEHKGWKFYEGETDGMVPRIQIVDQVANIVADLRAVKADPANRARRRIILTAWNPPMIPEMGLPPCHTLSQWLPVNGYLDCVCHWRSIDMFLGAPFNFCQYAILAHIFGRLSGLKPRYLVLNIADCHLYDNQFDQVREQLTRDPRPLPQLAIDPKFFRVCLDLSVEQMLEADPAWFSLDGYEPHKGRLRAEVAV
jgi:thymidylate synthase